MKRGCAICGGVEKRVLHPQRFVSLDDAAVLAGYDVVVCERCGFGFADDVPDQAQLDRYYEDMSKYENQDRAGAVDAPTLQTYREIADTLKAHFPDKGGRILDAGCATGGLLNELKHLGYQNVMGLDPSPACVQIAQEAFGIKVLQGSLVVPPPLGGTFDLLIVNSVLEHLSDLRRALHNFQNVVSDGGLVWIEVPDVTRFNDFLMSPYQQFSVEHINYFSGRSLSALFGLFGFECIASFQNVRSLGGTKDPALSCIFRKGVPVEEPPQWDGGDEAALKSYVEASRLLNERVTRGVAVVVETQEPIIVWGVGTHTLRLLAEGTLARANMVAFVDSNPHYQGRTLMGIPVLSPGALSSMPNRILISSRVFQEAIREQIRDRLGLQNGVITLYED
jgi:SAM-dependent methyltransferase